MVICLIPGRLDWHSQMDNVGLSTNTKMVAILVFLNHLFPFFNTDLLDIHVTSVIIGAVTYIWSAGAEKKWKKKKGRRRKKIVLYKIQNLPLIRLAPLIVIRLWNWISCRGYHGSINGCYRIVPIMAASSGNLKLIKLEKE